MGQYYMPVIKRGNKLRRVYGHDFGNGLKLTEHSYISNHFVNVVANEIVDNPAQLYWVGDYAEMKDFKSESMFNRIYNYAWISKRRKETTVENPNEKFDWNRDWYFINHTKKQFMLMPRANIDLWIFSPISLLTAIGNGRGGGDYCGRYNEEMVGYWAGDQVSLSIEKPNDKYVDVTEDTIFGSDGDMMTW